MAASLIDTVPRSINNQIAGRRQSLSFSRSRNILGSGKIQISVQSQISRNRGITGDAGSACRHRQAPSILAVEVIRRVPIDIQFITGSRRTNADVTRSGK